MDYSSSAQFVSSLVKSLQSLCNGYVEFDTWVQVRGQLYLTTDTGKTIEFVIDEKVCKSNEYKAFTVGNNFQPAPAVERYEPLQRNIITTRDRQEYTMEGFENSIFEQIEPPGNIHDLVQAARHTDPNFQFQYTTGADGFITAQPQRQYKEEITIPAQVISAVDLRDKRIDEKPILPLVTAPYEIKKRGPMARRLDEEGPHKCEICGKGINLYFLGVYFLVWLIIMRRSNLQTIEALRFVHYFFFL